MTSPRYGSDPNLGLLHRNGPDPNTDPPIKYELDTDRHPLPRNGPDPNMDPLFKYEPDPGMHLLPRYRSNPNICYMEERQILFVDFLT